MTYLPPPPPPPPPRCVAFDASVMCDSRRTAMRAGEFAWVTSPFTGRSGWAFPIDPLRWPPWKGPPAFSWTYCPFCNGPLPPTDTRRPHAQADGEDGG